MTTRYVLHVEFADDPPRVAAFDTFGEAEHYLDYFEVSVFDPPINDGLDPALLRARIFECEDSNWGTEVDIAAARKRGDAVPLEADTETIDLVASHEKRCAAMNQYLIEVRAAKKAANNG